MTDHNPALHHDAALDIIWARGGDHVIYDFCGKGKLEASAVGCCLGLGHHNHRACEIILKGEPRVARSVPDQNVVWLYEHEDIDLCWKKGSSKATVQKKKQETKKTREEKK